jgi:threonine/homoserine/homoserine lactone efflux protein
MQPTVWLALVTLFLAGGLTPGPAVLLVTTSSLRYGFWSSLQPAIGVCVANLVWVALSASGVAALARTLPAGFLALRVAGVGYILWIAWRMAFSGPLDVNPSEAPPRVKLFARGLGLQLANPYAVVFFGGLLPAYIDAGKPLVEQCAIIMVTITVTELCGLVTYAAAAHWVMRRFSSKSFAAWFYRGSALAMAGSALVAVWSTR